MTSHRLAATPETTRDAFSREHAPVLAVDPGDAVTVSSLDASGYLARPDFPGQEQPRMIAEARGHCLTGPIEVRGARPGDLLALRLVSLRPGDWGWTVSGGRDTPVTRRLGVAAALALASTSVDIRITQVANQTWGAHAILPAGLLNLA